MSIPKNPFEEMMRTAQDMAKAMNPALETFSPQGFEAMMPKMPKDIMELAFGNTFNTEGLDAKTRLLLTLAGLTLPQRKTALSRRLFYFSRPVGTDLYP